MNQMHIILAAIVLVLAISVINGCSRMTEQHTAEEGEESGTELALNETYDKVRNGARLILAYNAQSNSFEGTVENTTAETLKRVRVEVHLSNGKELGPTPSADCTATGNSGHSLRQDCGIISIYLKGVSDGETKTKKLHSRV